jgi:hypothetical protein
MKSFTDINAYEEVIKENESATETIKSTLFCVALLVYLARATNFVLFIDKVWGKIKKGIVTRNAILVLGWDTPVCQRRATLVSVVDSPTHKRRQTLELVHDVPIIRHSVSSDDGNSSVKETFDCESTGNTSCASSAYESFCQEKREYVKNWKEERIKRQLFEMWHALDENGQKEWLDKADALDKLFGLTDASDVYKDTVTPKYPKTEFCKLLTKHASARAYFDSEMCKFRQFYTDHKEPGKPPPVTANYHTENQAYTQQQQSLSSWTNANRDNQTYTNKVLQEWKSSDNVSVRKSLRDAVCDAMTYSTIPKTTDEQIWAKTAKEWEASYDAFEHAYDLFCEKVKNTNPQMQVTEDDVNEHLSRMWEVLDDKVANTTGYAYFRGCNRDSLAKTNPDISKTDLESKLTRMWMELSKKEREEWADSAGVLYQRTRQN